MIRVTVSVTSQGLLDFRFTPEAKFWVLNGVSLAGVETCIRAAIASRMPNDAVPTAAIAIQVSEIAQGAIDGMVAKGLIGEV